MESRDGIGSNSHSQLYIRSKTIGIGILEYSVSCKMTVRKMRCNICSLSDVPLFFKKGFCFRSMMSLLEVKTLLGTVIISLYVVSSI